MKLTIFCISLLVALGLCAPTTHAAQLTTQIVLLDPNTLAPLPTVAPNTYAPFTGDAIVQVQGIVNNPNFTDQQKAVAVRGKALGVQLVAGKLLTNGLPNAAVPLTDPGSPFPTWQGFVEYIGTGNPGFVNVYDADGDGDLDVNGAGTANPSLSLSSVGQLPGVQVGALGMVPLFEGLYHFNGNILQSTFLSFLLESVNLYVDPTTGAASALTVEDGTGYVGLPILFNVPEPSTYALAGFGLVGLVFAMRRKAA